MRGSSPSTDTRTPSTWPASPRSARGNCRPSVQHDAWHAPHLTRAFEWSAGAVEVLEADGPHRRREPAPGESSRLREDSLAADPPDAISSSIAAPHASFAVRTHTVTIERLEELRWQG